jgi:hypothetical protein
VFPASAASRNVTYSRFLTGGFFVLTAILVAYVLPRTLPNSNTEELTRISAGDSAPPALAEGMTSKDLVEAQAGKQTAVNVALVKAREIDGDPLGSSSERAAQLASLEAHSSNVPDPAPTTVVNAKSSEGSLQLALPNGWREVKPEGESTKIAVTNGKGARVVVRVYPKEDFKDARALATFAVTKLKLSDGSDVKKEDIRVNGNTAARLSVVGTASNNMRVGYLITIIESEGFYVEVLGRTDAYSFAEETQELGAFASALTFTSSTAPAPPPAIAAKPPAPKP